MSNEIKTPRCDSFARYFSYAGDFHKSKDGEWINIEDARTLERETVELREQLDNIKSSTTIAKFDEFQTRLKTAVALLGRMVCVGTPNGHTIDCICRLCETRRESKSFLESNKTK